MNHLDKTRESVIAQKKGVRVAVVPFLEADILVDGAVYVILPPRVLIMSVTSNIMTASGTASATVDLVANGVVLVDELDVAAAGVSDQTLAVAARYLPTGGELVVLAGAVTPADGALIGELVVEYIELDKNCGEYTRFLVSA